MLRNILINYDQLKIRDFGISKTIRQESYIINATTGTLVNMTPERINGNDYDLKSSTVMELMRICGNFT